MINLKKILIAIFLSMSFFSCSAYKTFIKSSEKALNDKYVAIKQYREEKNLVYNNINLDYKLYTNYDDGIKTLKIARINEKQIYTKYKEKYRLMNLVDLENNGYIDENKEIYISLANKKVFLLEKENIKNLIEFEEIIK